MAKRKQSRSSPRKNASKTASEGKSYIRILKWVWRVILTVFLLYHWGQYQGYYNTTEMMQLANINMNIATSTQQQQQQHVTEEPTGALEAPKKLQLPARNEAAEQIQAQNFAARANNAAAHAAPNDANNAAPNDNQNSGQTTTAEDANQIAISTTTTTTPNNSNNLPKFEGDLPSDWNEILKLRNNFMQKHHPPPPQPPNPQASSSSITVRIPPHLLPPSRGGGPIPAVGEMGSNGQPIILAATDALYQKGTWDKAPIIIEKYKLVFFTVPKVGCTAFKQLFRRMMGYPNWKDHQYYQMPFLPHNPDTNGLKYLSDYPFEKANEMLTSPEWTRAIFVRKPEERVLSAYLDKSAYSKGYYLRMRCCDKVATGSPEWKQLQCGTGTKQYTPPQEGETNTPIIPFREFLHGIMPRCPDPHWEPQAIRMAPKYWERINFIGRFESVFEDTKKLLIQLGAWDVYGASGWEVDGRDGAIFDPSQKAKHGTNAQDKSSKSEYLTPENMAMIDTYYQLDYGHPQLQFERPR